MPQTGTPRNPPVGQGTPGPGTTPHLDPAQPRTARSSPTTADILMDPGAYGYTECPRCHGYGSSLHEACPKCSLCGGLGLVPPPEAA